MAEKTLDSLKKNIATFAHNRSEAAWEKTGSKFLPRKQFAYLRLHTWQAVEKLAKKK